MRFQFGEHSLDAERRELRRGATVVAVEPQVFDLILHLLGNRERVVGKEELIEAVWGGRIVSDATIDSRVKAARQAIGDSGAAQALIRTFPRKGIRFVGAAEPDAAPDAHSPPPSAPIQARGAAPRLSIVVLPFNNIGGDSEQDYFVDGVTESLTTDLSRMSSMLVIGRNTAFTYKGKPVDLKRIGRELNVRYALEGSVQRSGGRMRVNVQLIDAESGNHLWAERFDKPLADLFDMQDEIVARLARAVDTQLITAEARRSERAPDPDSMDLCFQGAAAVNRGLTPENLAQARSFYQRALALSPDNVDALAGTAYVDMHAAATYFLGEDRAAHIAAAEAATMRALRLAPDHAFAHMCLGFVMIYTGRPAEGIAQCERALELDRNMAIAHAGMGVAKNTMGRFEETEAHVRKAMRLSPRDTYAYLWLCTAASGLLCLGANEEAIGWLRRSIEAYRNYAPAHFYLAAALAHLKRSDEARSAVQAGMTIVPAFSLGAFRKASPSQNPAFLAGRERIIEGMRQAGVPEG